MERIAVGVIGAGYWGRKHVDEYSKLESADLRVVSDLVPGNLEFCRERYDVPSVTGDHTAVLGDPGIDGVSICTPNETHYAICREALLAGKHVLIEKPVTLDSKEAMELVELAREKNLVLSVGHIFRFNNAVNKLKELIAEDFFGKLFSVKLQWTHLFPSPPGRDVLFDLAPHSFDILNHVLDEWPTSVTCRAGTFRRKELEELAYIMCDFPGDVMAHIEIGWLEPEKVRRIIVLGENRCAMINTLSQEFRVYENEYEYNLELEHNNTIRDELAHFVECVQEGKTSVNSGMVGARTIELIECAFRSQREGRTVNVGE